jgi:hypothetical protein
VTDSALEETGVPETSPQNDSSPYGEPAGETSPATASPSGDDPSYTPPADPYRLEMAQERLDQMTAQDLLEMQETMVDLEEQAEMPEAKSSITVKLYSINGGEAMLTTRSQSGARAWDEMLRTIRYVMKTVPEMRWSPSRAPHTRNAPAPAPIEYLDTPAGPAPFPGGDAPATDPQGQPSEPQYIPVGADPTAQATQTAIERLRVHRVKHVMTEGGKHLVKVLGPDGSGFSVHGVSAWPESLPPNIKKVFETWPVGQLYRPPASMEIAYLERDDDGKVRRVRSFGPVKV